MTDPSCPVSKAKEKILRFKGPMSDHFILDELLMLYEAIGSGMTKIKPLERLDQILSKGSGSFKNKALNELLSDLQWDLRVNYPIYESHVKALYCPTGSCPELKGAPCQIACPAKVDVPSYVALVGAGRYEEALEVLWEDIPIPGVLGRVCVHPCEDACRRRGVDGSVSICLLKRVAFDKGFDKAHKRVPPLEKEKVAVVGSGPAGLSCAYFLRKQGYGVTIFEKLPVLGGMLAVGIPAYRLPREVLTQEIDMLKFMGIEMVTNTIFGKDLTLEGLKRDGFKAVFVAPGLHLSRRLNVPNEDATGVLRGVEFLREVALGSEISLSKDAIVIGGGNVAIDVALTALRKGAGRIRLVCLEQRHEMPAWEHEIHEALEEGVEIINGWGPKEFLVEGKVLKGIAFKRCVSVFDEQGRFNPKYDETEVMVLESETALVAIGQAPDLEGIREQGIEISPRGTLSADPERLMTNLRGVFVGGDAFYGPKTVIEAVAQGKRAAFSIMAYLSDQAMDDSVFLPKRRVQAGPLIRNAKVSLITKRTEPGKIEKSLRINTFEEVIRSIDTAQATQEAERCLRCDFCIACGRCLRVCRDSMEIDALSFSFVKDGPEITDPKRTEERCIGCGSCAVNCPTGAINISQEDSQLKLNLVGMELATHQRIRCRSCGIYFVSPSQKRFIMERIPGHQRISFEEDLCPECSRKIRAQLRPYIYF